VRVQMHSHHRMQQLHPPQMHINWAHFSARSFSRFDNSIIFVFVRLATADNGCGVGRHYVEDGDFDCCDELWWGTRPRTGPWRSVNTSCFVLSHRVAYS
jgi:hypothetical protein